MELELAKFMWAMWTEAVISFLFPNNTFNVESKWFQKLKAFPCFKISSIAYKENKPLSTNWFTEAKLRERNRVSLLWR